MRQTHCNTQRWTRVSTVPIWTIRNWDDTLELGHAMPKICQSGLGSDRPSRVILRAVATQDIEKN
jgi:hypothetical protein